MRCFSDLVFLFSFAPLKNRIRVFLVAQGVRNPTSTHEDAGLIPGLALGLRIRCCPKLWGRLQMQFRSRVTAAVVVQVSTSGRIRPPAGDLPYAKGAALRRKETKCGPLLLNNYPIVNIQ